LHSCQCGHDVLDQFNHDIVAANCSATRTRKNEIPRSRHGFCARTIQSLECYPKTGVRRVQFQPDIRSSNKPNAAASNLATQRVLSAGRSK